MNNETILLHNLQRETFSGACDAVDTTAILTATKLYVCVCVLYEFALKGEYNPELFIRTVSGRFTGLHRGDARDKLVCL